MYSKMYEGKMIESKGKRIMSCQVCVEKFCAYKVPIFNEMSCDELEDITIRR